MNNKGCFAHGHMTMRQYGLWTRIRELQRKYKFVYFDGQSIADSFESTPRSTVYKDTTALVKAGWFELKAEQKKKSDGTFGARKIVAISHKEWASKFPSECPNRSISETGEKGVRSICETDRSICETDRSTLMDKDFSKEQTPTNKQTEVPHPPLSRETLQMRESASECCGRPKSQPYEVLTARRILDGLERPSSIYAPHQTLEWAKQVIESQAGKSMGLNSPVASAESGSNVQ